MLFFNKKKVAPGQPHPDWPWALNLGGMPSGRPDWKVVEAELRKLNLEDVDSFLILEQKDPSDPDRYWFIQSAMNRAGPKPGWYTVEVGWGLGKDRGLLDTDVRTVEEVIPYFHAAFHRKPVDVSGFADQSDMLG